MKFNMRFLAGLMAALFVNSCVTREFLTTKETDASGNVTRKMTKSPWPYIFSPLIVAYDAATSPIQLYAVATKGMSEEERSSFNQSIGNAVVTAAGGHPALSTGASGGSANGVEIADARSSSSSAVEPTVADSPFAEAPVYRSGKASVSPRTGQSRKVGEYSPWAEISPGLHFRITRTSETRDYNELIGQFCVYNRPDHMMYRYNVQVKNDTSEYVGLDLKLLQTDRNGNTPSLRWHLVLDRIAPHTIDFRGVGDIRPDL